MMNFPDALRICLRDKYATFQGRATRAEYWWFSLFYFGAIALWIAIVVTFAEVVGLASRVNATSSAPFIIIAATSIGLLIYLIIPFTCVTVRRFHDYNLSGWWYLGFIAAGAIPVIGWAANLAVMVVACLKGTQGPNKFGNDPVGANDTEIFA